MIKVYALNKYECTECGLKFNKADYDLNGHECNENDKEEIKMDNEMTKEDMILRDY